jgi:hypothetical protein
MGFIFLTLSALVLLIPIIIGTILLEPMVCAVCLWLGQRHAKNITQPVQTSIPVKIK